jgi:leucyl aminopeptidase
MEIKFIEESLENINADLELIVVIEKNFDHKFVKDYKDILEQMGFAGEQDEVVLLPESKKLIVGASSFKAIDIRSAIAVAIRSVLGKKYKSIKLATYSNYNKCTATIRAQAEALVLGNYSYDRYKSKNKDKTIKEIYISSEAYDKKIKKERLKKAVTNGLEIALSVNFTRDIVNTPPDDFYPKIMARVAKDIADTYGLECNILNKKEIEGERMGALLAVSRASAHPPRVIHLAHKPKNPKAVISLIGKGLTYDSGGLSLKPSDFMVTMKSDKSGGSAVLGIMQIVAKLKLPIEVHGFVGAVENMIGGNAYKPDDVLLSKSGKTIEVRNTDAEGRLVLADMLTYAQEKVEADYIIDLATLTGACVVGLGNYTIGVMGNNDKLIEKMLFACNISAGEYAAKLPFNRHLCKTLKSSIADVCHISNTRYGGAITAGLFLEQFIEEKNKDKWIHLDIAGPAYVEHEWAENPFGASGAGVRAVARFIEKLDGRH